MTSDTTTTDAAVERIGTPESEAHVVNYAMG
jgi:hypothetical protein